MRVNRVSSEVNVLRLANPILMPCLLLATAGAARSQQIDREPCRGVVVAADAKPVAGAEVVLGSRLMDTLGSSGQDVVRVTTDANGRFQASLLEGRFYSVWAGWTVGAHTHVTGVAESVSGGQTVRLEESPARRRATKLAVQGVAPFEAHGPLRFQVHVFTDNRLLLELPAPVEGRIELPPLPESIDVDALSGRGHALTKALVERTELRLIQPSACVQLTVVDDHGQPVPGARVVAHAAGEPAVTDAGGQAVFFVPEHPDVALTVSKPGFGEVVVRVPDHLPRSRPASAELVEHAMKVELRPAPRTVHRLLGRDGQPLANATVFAGWLMQSGEEPGPTAYCSSGPHVAQSDASGSYMVCGPSDPTRMRQPSVTVLLPAEARASFAPPRDFPLPPATVTRHGTLDVDLTDYSILAIEVVAADGSPVAGARVSTAPLGLADREPQATNRRGRVCLLLPHGAHHLEAWHPEHGFALVAITTAPSDAAPRTERLTLRPLATCAGRVVTPDGDPIPQADLWLFMPLGSLEDSVAWNFLSLVNKQLLRGKTDRDGRFQLRFAPMAGLRWRMWVRSGERRVEYVLSETGTESVEIVLR